MPPAPKPRKRIRARAKEAVSYLGRLTTLVAALAVVAALYISLRTFVVGRLVRDYAQAVINQLATADVERVGRVEVDADGNLVLHRIEITTTRNGVKRLFYRAERAVIALDGWPLRDSDLRVARIDLFRPEFFVRREQVDGWNLLWALHRRPPPPAPEGPPPPPAPPAPRLAPAAPRDPFPFNGVHLHEGIVHVLLEGRSGREVSYLITNVEAQIARREGRLVFEPLYGDFYGGRLAGHAIIRSITPFAIDVRLAVTDADVSLLAERASFSSRPVTGHLNGVLAVTADASTQHRPIGAGRLEISKGNLYDLPAFTGILGLLALNPVPDRIVNSAQVLFTAERDHVRIDEMNFLGSPISLFGEGTMGLTGEDLHVVLIPRLEKSWGSILPIIGAPLQILADIALGNLVPLVVTGTFWEPKVNAEPEKPVSEEIKKRAGGGDHPPK
ncbi:MAG TPA: hypothetical protein VK661_12770 [Planctomycetota bacterium]|nr:hypothetical protein [Planctomycetota bacterium]